MNTILQLVMRSNIILCKIVSIYIIILILLLALKIYRENAAIVENIDKNYSTHITKKT